MINYSQLEDIFSQNNLTIHEYNVELNDEEIETPFIVYTATDGDSFEADGINYFRLLNVGIALLDEVLNFSLQRKIESIFDEYSTRYDKQINFDDEARIYTITYTISVVDNGED